MTKLYCFVDETGQDTKGDIFIVSVVLTNREIDKFQCKLEEIEQQSGKRKLKWNKTNFESRLKYLNLIIKELKSEKSLRYSVFKQTSDYDLATMIAISNAFRFQRKPYKALIYIDALAKMKRSWYGVQLRKLGVHTYKIQGVVKDENNSIIRLADTVAGWVRDSLEGKVKEFKLLFDRAILTKTLIEV